MRARNLRAFAALGTAAALLLGATSAGADIVHNTLDGTVDATHETMNLVAGGSTGSTTLQIQLEGREAGDHPGCNIPGSPQNPHHLAMSALSSDPAVATVAWLNDDDTFNSCSEVLTVVVTPLAAGPSTISFTGTPSDVVGDPHVKWSYVEAAFVVNVAPAETPGGQVCDADPAAPAWAAAILKANGVKNKTVTQNTISAVAAEMGLRASFRGVAKNQHPAYEQAVLEFVRQTLSNPGLVMGARPGWECTPA